MLVNGRRVCQDGVVFGITLLSTVNDMQAGDLYCNVCSVARGKGGHAFMRAKSDGLRLGQPYRPKTEGSPALLTRLLSPIVYNDASRKQIFFFPTSFADGPTTVELLALKEPFQAPSFCHSKQSV